MVTYYNITEDELKSKNYEEGALYCCSDSGNIYLDSPALAERIKMSNTIIICASESKKPIAPIPDKIYCVLETGCLYIHTGEKWVSLGNRAQLHFENVVVENGKLTIQDSRILKTDKAEFIPDLSVCDLASNISATCSDGSVTVNLTSSYPIVGSIIIN